MRTASFATAASAGGVGGERGLTERGVTERVARSEGVAPGGRARSTLADDGARGLGDPWAEAVEGGASRLCLMVRDEATGHIIGIGGCRIRQIASELWPNVNQLSIASRVG